MRISRKFQLAVVAGMGLGFVSLNVAAVDLRAVADVGVGRTDNIARTNEDTLEEDIIRAGLEFGLVEETQRINANVQGQLYRFSYQNNTFDDETLGFINALGQFKITERILGWTISDNLGQQMVNVFQPIRPGNREWVNIFSTGPDFDFLFGARTGLDMQLRWTDVRYETRPRDNQRQSAFAQLYRQMSETRRLGLNAFAERIEYDDQTFNSDLDRYRASGQFEAASDRTNMSLEAGWNWIEIQDEKGDGFYFDFSLSRQVSGRSTLALVAGREFSESGNLFQIYNGLNGRGNQFGAPPEDVDSENTSDPFTNEFARGSYNFNGERTNWVLAADWRQETYLERPERDRRIYGLTGMVMRELNQHIILNGFVNAGRRQFTLNNREDEDRQIGVGLEWVVGPRWSVRVDYDYLNRDSTDTDSKFNENRLFLSAQYTIVQ